MHTTFGTRWRLLSILCAAGLLAAAGCSSNAANSADKEKKEKGKVITLDGLSSPLPAEWKVEKTTSSFRFAQFRLPALKDDKIDADVVIFKGLGGSVEDNVRRWKAQFTPPPGKNIDDVATVREIKIGGRTATYVDVHGTFKAPPFDPKYKGKEQPNFRMLAVQWQGPETSYHIKLTGPARTVEHYKKGFDTWLQGFKKD